MHLTIIFIFIFVLLICIIPICSLSVAKIINATYSKGSPFSRLNFSTSNACMCLCINHPHCLTMSVTKTASNMYYCQLFATYPVQSSQLLSSLTSNVTIYVDRTLSSVYINNGTRLSNPTNLFSNTTNSWIPVFKLFTGNNQSFLWLNSSNLTTLTPIPQIPINQITSHWFNILISQWNQNSYIPNQIAIAFIVNQTNIIDFIIFNSTQSNITTWFSITHIISTQYWEISQYQNTTIGQTQMTSVYTDSDCVRSFNCNFKYSTNGCTTDFIGYFFVYGGYKDLCISAVRNMSTVSIPTIYYCPSTAYTNGSLNDYNIANGIMGFVQ